MDKVKLMENAITSDNFTGLAMEALRALEQSEARFHDIADRIEQGLWVRSADGKVCLYLNPAFQKIWGRSLDDMNRIQWVDTVHPDDRDRAHQFYLRQQDSSRDYTQSYRIIRPDGEVRCIENQGYSILDADGNLLRMAGIARDVTKQKHMEEELRLAQKLESLGKLSSGIAHEINTPCQYVSDNLSFLSESISSLSMLLKELPSLLELGEKAGLENSELKRIQKMYDDTDVEYLFEEIPAALNQSKNGMEQIKKIVQSMKGFSHPGDKKAVSDINQIILNTCVMAKSEWKYVAELITKLDEKLPLTKVLPSALTQVFLNLIINAAHAIATASDDKGMGTITIQSLLENGAILIKITDTGSGIPEAVLEHIFDPFYTTKEPGKGTGQGLSIVHRIIYKGHGGSILVDSKEGLGTCFTISLPMNAEELSLG